MRTNVVEKLTEKTHEGGKAVRINAEQALRRSVMACMLWESEFYEDGQEIGTRIAQLASALPFEKVASITIEAREQMKLRHAPLWLVVALLKAKHQGRKVGDLIARICQRADEPAELLALYWKDQPQAPLPKQLKVGLARALSKFDEYQFAKYNHGGAVKLRDVLFLSHAKPKDAGDSHYTKDERKHGDEYDLTPGELLYKRIAEGELQTPDTWEVGLSAGKDKKETFERLIAKGNLGGLAFLRNLRNMAEAGIPKGTVAEYAGKADLRRVLPFRFIAAARAVPQWEDLIEPLMLKAVEGRPRLMGKTVLLVDVSGSMGSAISGKSEMLRMDAAMGLGVLLRELCEEALIFTFSDSVVAIPPRRGFALRDAMRNSQMHGGTMLAGSLNAIHQHGVSYDRIIVITDEQTADGISPPRGKGYVLNVASNKNGVGYGQWTHIDGWSEACIDYIRSFETA